MGPQQRLQVIALLIALASIAAIIRAIIALAETLNIRVVAEGVETYLQLDFLRRSGCDEIQGYLFSKPVAPEDFSKLLALPELGLPTRCEATGTD